MPAVKPPAAPVAVIHDDVFAEHDWPGHPESEERLLAIAARLRDDPVLSALPTEQAADADPAQLLSVHRESLLRIVESTAQSGGGWVDSDTYCTARSYDVARRAAGAAIRAVDSVCGGEARAVFGLVRPPGHHATPDRPMGFCLFNNVAVGARFAQREWGLERVAIVDIDVHHGNGTQDIFYDDPSVLYCSLHQWPLYPGTGRASETGAGRGDGATVNVPVPPRTTAAEWLSAFDERVLPALREHRPQLVMVSAGYDAHRADPLAFVELETDTYAAVAQRLSDVAGEHAGGRMVWLLEGGYNLAALADSVAATLTQLAGDASAPKPAADGER
jgi:acetoin utilization deacetylase AcuC-like enzyme